MDSLPYASLEMTEARVDSHEQTADVRAPKRKILLIEDNRDQREITRSILVHAGYAYSEASCGEDGLRLLLSEKPDLILLDYMMPTMTGYDVVRELASNPDYRPVADTPVIMLTAKTSPLSHRTKLFELGLCMYLEKPFANRELINVIENIFVMNDLRRRNKELEQNIKRTEYKYKDLIDNASDLIFTLDDAGSLVSLNRRFSGLTDYSRDAWLGRNWLDLVSPEDRHISELNYKDAVQGKTRHFEIHLAAPNGKTLCLSVNLNPIFQRGEVVGCVGFARDVTQRKKLEQEITDLKNFNESIIQSIGSGLMTIDPNERITSFNQAAEETLGYRALEVIGASIREIFPPEECDKLLPMSGERSVSLLNREMELTRKDKKKIFVGFTVAPRIDQHNKSVGTIISFRDISQIKQMQAEVLRMDRMASLGVLASGIAHEIRNPLAGIKTVAQTLEEEIEAGDHRREYLGRIVRQVNRMDELLRTIFTYARPQPPVRKPARLEDIIQEVIALMEQRMSRQAISLEQIYPPELPSIYVDVHQIEQVFINLFLNALDAMPSGGAMTITAQGRQAVLELIDRRGKRHPSSSQPALYVEVKVSDTGAGISKENLQTIFDPFFTTKAQGSGLGLSIVYRIIEEHRGDIQVESEEGKGTMFTLLLPTQE
jgi:PAS domain S-box-containing protein